MTTASQTFLGAAAVGLLIFSMMAGSFGIAKFWLWMRWPEWSLMVVFAICIIAGVMCAAACLTVIHQRHQEEMKKIEEGQER